MRGLAGLGVYGFSVYGFSSKGLGVVELRVIRVWVFRALAREILRYLEKPNLWDDTYIDNAGFRLSTGGRRRRRI